jgi:hypothetical protein
MDKENFDVEEKVPLAVCVLVTGFVTAGANVLVKLIDQ